MKVGNMYRVEGLARLKRNNCLTIGYWPKEDPRMETDSTASMMVNRKCYKDGDIMVCIGKVERNTGHYEPQPFYRVLTLDGKTALISKATRKYFKPVKSNLCEPDRPEECP